MKTSAGQQAVNRSHAKIRALVEQAMATLKTWLAPAQTAMLHHPHHH